IWELLLKQVKYRLRYLAVLLDDPTEVLDGPQQGFAFPVVHWMRHELKELIQPVLLDPKALQRGYLNTNAVRQVLDEHFRGRRNQSGAIWRLLMLELWHRNFLERFSHTTSPLESSDIASVSRGMG